jgi:hypothetical protein
MIASAAQAGAEMPGDVGVLPMRDAHAPDRPPKVIDLQERERGPERNDRDLA